MTASYLEKMNTIKAFCFDVDGVLTDGTLILLPTGDQVRTMNIRDGYALKTAVNKGYPVGIITGGRAESTKDRLSKLGVKDIYLGVSNKLERFEEFLIIHDLKAEEVLYMGDDMPDYEVMSKCGLPCCPGDAVNEIKEISTYITQEKGGAGCVRDVIEKTLKLQGNWK